MVLLSHWRMIDQHPTLSSQTAACEGCSHLEESGGFMSWSTGREVEQVGKRLSSCFFQSIISNWNDLDSVEKNLWGEWSHAFFPEAKRQAMKTVKCYILHLLPQADPGFYKFLSWGEKWSLVQSPIYRMWRVNESWLNGAEGFWITWLYAVVPFSTVPWFAVVVCLAETK